MGFRVFGLAGGSFRLSVRFPAFLVLRIGTEGMKPVNPQKIKVETFRIDHLIRTPKVEKLSLRPIS